MSRVAVPAANGSVVLPSASGLKAWAWDPVVWVSTGVLVSGTQYVTKVPTTAPFTLTNVYYRIAVAGSTLTATQNIIAVYDNAGTKLVDLADQTTNFGSAGLKIVAASASIPAGGVWVLVQSVGTTPPALNGGGANATLANANVSGAATRVGVLATGQAATAGPALVPANITAPTTALPIWFGLS